MLILSRRPNEDIVIGQKEGSIKISVLGLKGGQVKLGIEASREIPVHRYEVYKRIHCAQAPKK